MKCPVCHQKMRKATLYGDDFYCRKCQLRHNHYDSKIHFYYMIKGYFIDYHAGKNESAIKDFNNNNYYWTYAGLIDYIEIEYLIKRCKKLNIFS